MTYLVVGRQLIPVNKLWFLNYYLADRYRVTTHVVMFALSNARNTEYANSQRYNPTTRTQVSLALPVITTLRTDRSFALLRLIQPSWLGT